MLVETSGKILLMQIDFCTEDKSRNGWAGRSVSTYDDVSFS